MSRSRDLSPPMGVPHDVMSDPGGDSLDVITPQYQAVHIGNYLGGIQTSLCTVSDTLRIIKIPSIFQSGAAARARNWQFAILY